MTSTGLSTRPKFSLRISLPAMRQLGPIRFRTDFDHFSDIWESAIQPPVKRKPLFGLQDALISAIFRTSEDICGHDSASHQSAHSHA
jgi:hypothetical protein